MTADPSGLRGLYAVTDSRRYAGAQLLETCDDILSAGASLLQYRDKSQDQALRKRQARALRSICDQHQTLLIINDDVELARDTGADGVHLGQGDLSIAAARARLGPGAIIGASCYNSLHKAQQALDDGADYLAFGSMYTSATKPSARHCDLSTLQQARAQFNCPIAVIGGIDIHNAKPLVAAGTDMLAVVSAVFDVDNPASAVAQLAALYSDSPSS